MGETTVVCFGPGPLFKGGISNYNTSLAKAFARRDNINVHIVSWSQQYPAIVPRDFIDSSSTKSVLEGYDIPVRYITNYNKPSTWRKTAEEIVALQPDIVVVQWYNAQQGLPLRKITKKLRQKTGALILFDLHFVVPKESSAVDAWFTRHGLDPQTDFITHAKATTDELKQLFPNKRFGVFGQATSDNTEMSVLELFHPVYTLYEPDPDFDIDANKKRLGLKEHVFLFFGFIRKYKGLHHAIEAFRIVAAKRDDVSLLICGESFWKTLDSSKLSTKIKTLLFSGAKKLLLRSDDDEKDYRPLAKINDSDLQSCVVVVNEFIPNEDVATYFQVSDSLLLFYERATPSGVESLSYNFKLPILATSVGHFPETVKNGYNGYLAEGGDVESMARVMLKQLEEPIQRQHVAESAEKMSWENYSEAIVNYYQNSRS